jgi:formate/nitrite transporter FocA (FNT family)
MAVLPFLDRQVRFRELARLWGLVYAGNLVGATLVSLAFAWLAPALGVVDPAVFGEIAHRPVDHPAFVILASAIAAGWSMGLLSSLVTASRDTIGQLVMI